MGIKTYNPYTPSRRNMTGSDFSEITKTTPEKSLCVSLKMCIRDSFCIVLGVVRTLIRKRKEKKR